MISLRTLRSEGRWLLLLLVWDTWLKGPCNVLPNRPWLADKP